MFFANSLCLQCGTPLGYEPTRGRLLPLEPAAEAGLWRPWNDDGGDGADTYRRCRNLDSPAQCNWLVPVDDTRADGRPQALCVACRLNRTIPNLDREDDRRRWGAIERAKRRVVSQLIALGLPVRSRIDEDPRHGLAFDFLSSSTGVPVMTGHADGLITLNVAEADDAERERVRVAMGEPSRTLLGHFRHEVGHYYWDRLVRGSPWLAPVRVLFGDERRNYAEALGLHHARGAPGDWPRRFITSYASAHPWEDWAETWAHYLHIVATVDTALSVGIDVDHLHIEARPWGADALWRAGEPAAAAFLGLLNVWTALTAAMNEMSRSMGQPDFYPFVVPRPAVAKLQMIDLIVHGARP